MWGKIEKLSTEISNHIELTLLCDIQIANCNSFDLIQQINHQNRIFVFRLKYTPKNKLNLFFVVALLFSTYTTFLLFLSTPTKNSLEQTTTERTLDCDDYLCALYRRNSMRMWLRLEVCMCVRAYVSLLDRWIHTLVCVYTYKMDRKAHRKKNHKCVCVCDFDCVCVCFISDINV